MEIELYFVGWPNRPCGGGAMFSFLWCIVFGVTVGVFIAAYIKDKPKLRAMYQDDKLLERMYDAKVADVKGRYKSWKEEKKSQIMNGICFWRRF